MLFHKDCRIDSYFPSTPRCSFVKYSTANVLVKVVGQTIHRKMRTKWFVVFQKIFKNWLAFEILFCFIKRIALRSSLVYFPYAKRFQCFNEGADDCGYRKSFSFDIGVFFNSLYWFQVSGTNSLFEKIVSLTP